MKKVTQISIAIIALLVISSIAGFYITAACRRDDWMILVVPGMVSVLLALSAWGAIREVGQEESKSVKDKEKSS